MVVPPKLPEARAHGIPRVYKQIFGCGSSRRWQVGMDAWLVRESWWGNKESIPKATLCCSHLARFPFRIKSRGLWLTFGLTCCSVMWMNLLVLVLGTAGCGLETGSDGEVPLMQEPAKLSQITCPAMWKKTPNFSMKWFGVNNSVSYRQRGIFSSINQFMFSRDLA